MTSTPSTSSASGTDEHPEVNEISAFGEGILPVERQEHVRAHLAECELCSDVRASLDEIRETLGTLPGPASMPEDVASRIDAALAAEALLDATAPDEEPPAVSRETGHPEAHPGDLQESASASGSEDARAGRAPVSRETPWADRPAGHPSGSKGPGRSSRTRTRERRRARRWRTATLVAAASVVVLGIGGITVQSLSNSSGQSLSSDAARDSPHEDTSDDDSDDSEDRKLEQHVHNLLAHQRGAPSESGPGTKAEKPSGSPTVNTKRNPSGDTTLGDDRAGGAGAAPSCVRDGIHRSESPLAVDADASYRGSPGYLVVLPHQGGDPHRVDVYVVDPSCVGADPSEPGRVLLKRTYTRG